MYPDLSYILHALIGTEPDNAASIIKSLGLLMVISFVVASWLLSKELRRKEKEGLLQPYITKITIGETATPSQLLINAVIGFVVFAKAAYAYQYFDAFKMDPASVVLSAKGNWLLGIVGAVIFAGAKWWEKNQEALPNPQQQELMVHPYERVGDITMIAAVAGIAGAKIFAMAEDIDKVFSGQLTLGQFLGQFFSGDGLAVYGGFILGFLAVFLYLRKYKMDILNVLDAAAPALLIAFGIGRMGCHLSGDGDWGIPVKKFSDSGELIYAYTNPGWIPDWLWSQYYPHNVINAGVPIPGCEWRYCYQLEIPVFPTSIYEFVLLIGLGGLLYAIRRRITIPGILFFLSLILNGFERFFLEKIRVNDRYEFLGFESTQAQFIAMGLMLIGIIGCVLLWWRDQKE